MKIIYTIVIILIILIGGFLYFTRPVAAPTEVTVNIPDAENAYVFATGTLARFHIGEVLRGADFMVVGTTSNVTGSVTVSGDTFNEIEISPVRINARTFKTDDPRRDNAIARAVLKSEEAANEYVEFTPRSFTGVTTTLAVGSTTSGVVSGDLKIIGTTRPASFNTTVTRTADGYTGSASTTINRADYAITIPTVPFVARADEQVVLFLDFVLRPAR